MPQSGNASIALMPRSGKGKQPWVAAKRHPRERHTHAFQSEGLTENSRGVEERSDDTPGPAAPDPRQSEGLHVIGPANITKNTIHLKRLPAPTGVIRF